MDAQDGQDCEGTLAERAKDAEGELVKKKILAILASSAFMDYGVTCGERKFRRQS